MSDAKLEEIYLSMSGSQRTVLYPFLDEATQARLPDNGELSYSNLSVSPATVQVGSVVTISVKVMNDGLIEFTEGVTLKIDGTTAESEMVTLMPGATKTITWTVSKASAGTYSVDVNGLTGSFMVEAPPVVVPANIVYKSITVAPTSVETGGSVTVTVTLENTGGVSGTASVELKVNNVVAETKSATVAAGATKTVTFTVTKDTAGSYTVSAGGKSASFTVTEPVTPPSGFPWIYVIGAVVVIAVAAYVYMQQKKA